MTTNPPLNTLGTGSHSPDSSGTEPSSVRPEQPSTPSEQPSTTVLPSSATTVEQKVRPKDSSSPQPSLLDNRNNTNTGRKTIGMRLQRQREQRAMSLQDCFEALRIRPEYLQALEQENIEELPDNRTAVLAYLRCYADYLGLEGSEITQRFEMSHFPEIHSPHSTPKPVFALPGNTILAIVLIVMVFLLVVSILQNYVTTTPQETPINAPTAPLPRQPDQQVTLLTVPVDPSVDPLAADPLAAAPLEFTPSTVLESETAVLNDNTDVVSDVTVARLINSQPTWVVMRGGSLSQEFQVLRETGEVMTIPVGEGVSIRVSNPQAVEIIFATQENPAQELRLSYNDALNQLGDAASAGILSNGSAQSAPSVSPQWIDIDALWDSLRQ